MSEDHYWHVNHKCLIVLTDEKECKQTNKQNILREISISNILLKIKVGDRQLVNQPT